jgi:predicted ribonuclease YlaK
MVLHWRVHVLLLLVSVSILPQFNNAFHACNNNRLKRTHANSITTDQQYAYSFRPNNSLSILPSSSTSSNTSSETSRVQIKSFSSISKITDDESYHGIQKKDEYDNENVVVDNNNQNADVDQNINQDQDQDRRQQYQSYIESIRCQNFMLNATNSDEENNNEVTIDLGNEGPNLVAVTGETGSGKSLLVFKVFQLIVGEKASIVRGSSSACGEVGECGN